MMLKGNRKGISLVEVLAVIVIGSIVMTFMYNLMSTGLNNSKHIEERALVLNEANYMIVVFREFHQRGEPYHYYLVGDSLIIEELDSSNRVEFKNYKFEINGTETPIDPDVTFTPIVIDPTASTVVNIEIIITSQKFDNISTEVKTKLHKL